jgi:hydrogenase maturation protease
MRILVAGIGNIFFGDDAFGCQVAADLSTRVLPEGVFVRDFGIRSYDLAYAMMEDYDAIILIDASPRGDVPGTVYLIEPDMIKNKLDESEAEVVNAHSMSPVRALQMVRHLGGKPKKVYVVGCEPGTLESDNGHMGLSAQVAAAVEPALNMITKLIVDLTDSDPEAFEAKESKTKLSSELEM